MDSEPVKLIVDSDPGVDDVLALLLALCSRDVDLKLISLVFGNCDTKNSLRNTVSLFHVLKLEEAYRHKQGQSCPWQNKSKPVVSVGLTTALDGSQLDATDFHGSDGLGNVHTQAPQFTATKQHLDLFDSRAANAIEIEAEKAGFIPSHKPSYEHILEVLRTEPENTVTIVAIGPLQNLAKAAELDPQTFARVKNIVVMGATINHPGNVSPLAEFNVYSDPLASAIIYSLTAKDPSVTLPPNSPDALKKFPKPLDVTLFPLDITEKHLLEQPFFESFIQDYVTNGSPLAQWMQTWLRSTFETSKKIYGTNDGFSHLHDPLALWYAVCVGLGQKDGWEIQENVDVRVEYQGRWTQGMTVVDNRGRAKSSEAVPNDRDQWLTYDVGNRVHITVSSPLPGASFGEELLRTILCTDEN